MIDVKIISKSGILPEYQTPGAAGMDIRAYMDEPVTLKPGERFAVPTGVYVEIPAGYELQIRARSGLAFKYGIGLVNGVGTIDSDYRGEIKVLLINMGNEDFIINSGDRIAQMVFSRYEQVNLIKSDTLNDSQRGEGGFGHTGIKK